MFIKTFRTAWPCQCNTREFLFFILPEDLYCCCRGRKVYFNTETFKRQLSQLFLLSYQCLIITHILKSRLYSTTTRTFNRQAVNELLKKKLRQHPGALSFQEVIFSCSATASLMSKCSVLRSNLTLSSHPTYSFRSLFLFCLEVCTALLYQAGEMKQFPYGIFTNIIRYCQKI